MDTLTGIFNNLNQTAKEPPSEIPNSTVGSRSSNLAKIFKKGTKRSNMQSVIDELKKYKNIDQQPEMSAPVAPEKEVEEQEIYSHSDVDMPQIVKNLREKLETVNL